MPADGPASKAGVRHGDRLIALAGTPVVSLEDFYRRLWSTARPGDKVSIEIERDGAVFAVEILSIDRYERLDSASLRE